jgi:hypothetical protein
MLSIEERNARIIATLKQTMPHVSNFSHDIGLPTKPVGHRSGIMTSTSIIRSYRRDHRRGSQHVEPQAVIDVLQLAHIRRWVLIGLYGYVGYLANPRATQDVDILVAEDEIEQVVEAICNRWPALIVDRREVVVRFRDPGEVAIDGEMKQVIDAMLPSNPCYHAILDLHHRLDESTGYRIPTIEAACASKFAALVSPYREWEKKSYDAGDLRSIMGPNASTLDQVVLKELGDLVYPDGGNELLEFLQLTIEKKPFPI